MSVAALVVSLLTAGFSGLAWYSAREASVAALRPHVDLDLLDDPDEKDVGIQVLSEGPGPALIKSVRFFVDRKLVKDAIDAGTTYGGLSEDEIDYHELGTDSTLGVGEHIWLIRYAKPKGKAVNPKNKVKFADFLDQRLAIQVRFCSTVRETDCQTKCSDEDDRCR
jgi:hypothetical protein